MPKKEIDFFGNPRLSLEHLLARYPKTKIWILDEEFLYSKKMYYIKYQEIIDIFKWNFEDLDIRTRQIKFKLHSDSKKVHKLELRHFLSNMILWFGFVITDSTDIMDDTFVFDFHNRKLDDVIDYIDNIILPNMNGVDLETQNRIVDDIAYDISAISAMINPIIGHGISYYSIMKAAEEIPEINEILYSTIDPKLQPSEIEEILTTKTDRLITLLSETDNDLKPLFQSGNNISKSQFKEIAVKIGLKSDITGGVIPHIVNCNLLIDGIKTPADFYTVATSGRKALTLSKTKMGEPGAFSKKMNTNTTPAVLRKDYEMCDSERPIKYHINDEKFLMLLDKRYYFDPETNELKLLNYKTDTHLIGQDVMFKSPCTCNSKEGICKYCYGELYEVNKDLFSVGCYAATVETESLGQSVLSAKHTQSTTSSKIEFNPEFDDNFELDMKEITIKNDATDDTFFISFDNVSIESEEDAEFYYTTSFSVIDENGNTKYHIQELQDSKMYLSEQLTAIYKKLKDKSKPISMDDVDDEDPLFTVEIKSQELTDPIKAVEKIFNTKDKMGCKTVDELCQVMAEYKINSGKMFNLVHDELMIRQLLRKISNKLEFPEWGPGADYDNYTILPLNSALYNSPSPTISLSYGWLKKQLLSPEFYTKTATSQLDPFFASSLSEII